MGLNAVILGTYQRELRRASRVAQGPFPPLRSCFNPDELVRLLVGPPESELHFTSAYAAFEVVTHFPGVMGWR